MPASTRARFALLLVGATVLAPSAAFAWGASGHRMISEIAAGSLPAEIPTFLRTPGGW